MRNITFLCHFYAPVTITAVPVPEKKAQYASNMQRGSPQKSVMSPSRKVVPSRRFVMVFLQQSDPCPCPQFEGKRHLIVNLPWCERKYTKKEIIYYRNVT
ncbi:hypothetical protein EVAR_71156_1 [Eumeta japonica]|uniref:Uncharacterized protein n=1 Tax=Eumeta variegata TaxID=151549 RepID=A0A4C1TEV9_EUMVA|nr:hypothetical protein EVAR_71156_1 [Eumeta japonica]